MGSVKHRSETPIKRKFKFSTFTQVMGLLGFLFSIINYFFLGQFSNWIFLYSVLIFLAGTFMGMEVFYVEEKDTVN